MCVCEGVCERWVCVLCGYLWGCVCACFCSCVCSCVRVWVHVHKRGREIHRLMWPLSHLRLLSFVARPLLHPPSGSARDAARAQTHISDGAICRPNDLCMLYSGMHSSRAGYDWFRSPESRAHCRSGLWMYTTSFSLSWARLCHRIRFSSI